MFVAKVGLAECIVEVSGFEVQGPGRVSAGSTALSLTLCFKGRDRFNDLQLTVRGPPGSKSCRARPSGARASGLIQCVKI